jgi:hypothetical protein
MKATIKRAVLIFEATGFVSDGTNPEYDRALVELITFGGGGTDDDFVEVSTEIFGTPRPDLWKLQGK